MCGVRKAAKAIKNEARGAWPPSREGSYQA